MPWKTDVEVEAGLADGILTPAIGEVIADVLSFTLLLAQDLGFGPARFIAGKIAQNEQRY